MEKLRSASGTTDLAASRDATIMVEDKVIKPNAQWVVWLQAVVVFLLLFSPGDLYNAIPVFIAQAYLLIAVLGGGSYWTVRTAVTVAISASVAAVVAAYAVAASTDGTWLQARAYAHVGVMLAAAMLLVGSSVHVLNSASGS